MALNFVIVLFEKNRSFFLKINLERKSNTNI